tara:strand:- start:1282 stop:1794 length:513 start_codon:yes stop_codon:yes gene_type:complete
MSRFDRRLKGVSDRPGSGVCSTAPPPFRMMGGLMRNRNRNRRNSMPVTNRVVNNQSVDTNSIQQNLDSINVLSNRDNSLENRMMAKHELKIEALEIKVAQLESLKETKNNKIIELEKINKDNLVTMNEYNMKLEMMIDYVKKLNGLIEKVKGHMSKEKLNRLELNISELN